MALLCPELLGPEAGLNIKLKRLPRSDKHKRRCVRRAFFSLLQQLHLCLEDLGAEAGQNKKHPPLIKGWVAKTKHSKIHLPHTCSAAFSIPFRL
ncbi:hypothetical protein A8L44_04495 [Bacillus sp. FJAT-27986]|nr:hypothetical protein A8L44_04495 [Bacillus sp. FJAT-27986]